MVIIDTLVKPQNEVSLFIQDLTGIKPTMLANKPNIDFIKKFLHEKMKYVKTLIMMAHNGSQFDDKIIKYDKLLPLDNDLFNTLTHYI